MQYYHFRNKLRKLGCFYLSILMVINVNTIMCPIKAYNILTISHAIFKLGQSNVDENRNILWLDYLKDKKFIWLCSKFTIASMEWELDVQCGRWFVRSLARAPSARWSLQDVLVRSTHRTQNSRQSAGAKHPPRRPLQWWKVLLRERRRAAHRKLDASAPSVI